MFGGDGGRQVKGTRLRMTAGKLLFLLIAGFGRFFHDLNS
jgi:hypothetical protein